MRRQLVTLGILFVLGLFMTLPATSHAEVELQEGMTQGDFALWLVKAIGADSKLPPASVAEDAVKFLTDLGVVPEGGWQKGEPMTKEALASLLEDEDAANSSWEELVEKVRDYVQALFDERQLGIFRQGSSATGSAALV